MKARRIGGLIILLAFFVIPKLWHYSSYQKLEGVVTDLYEARANGIRFKRSITYLAPRIIYYVNGEEKQYSIKDELIANSYSVGDKVTILYNPKDERKAYLDSFSSYWFPAPRLIVFALLCLVWIGVASIFPGRTSGL